MNVYEALYTTRAMRRVRPPGRPGLQPGQAERPVLRTCLLAQLVAAAAVGGVRLAGFRGGFPGAAGLGRAGRDGGGH